MSIEPKYLILLFMAVIAVISGIKKVFKLAITIAILALAYYVYTMYF